MEETPVDAFWKTILWQQFGAAIDMLENAMRACPDELWSAPSRPPAFGDFWYIVYHTLFFLNLYLSGSVDGFAPPTPFTLEELDPAGILPERPYSKAELLGYLEHGRNKCRTTIAALTIAQARRLCRFAWGETSFAELLLDNMRHVQEHTAQLNWILGQKIGFAPRWVMRTNN